jgi:hypothetical protein
MNGIFWKKLLATGIFGFSASYVKNLCLVYSKRLNFAECPIFYMNGLF